MHANNIVCVLIIQAEICGKMTWFMLFGQILYSHPKIFRNLTILKENLGLNLDKHDTTWPITA